MIYIMSYYETLLWMLEAGLMDGLLAGQKVSWPLSACRW